MKTISMLIFALIILAIGYFCIKGYSYCEHTIVKITEWGFVWDSKYINRVVKDEQSCWVSISAEIRPGATTCPGNPYIFTDTLIVTVSGPRQEVMDALVAIDRRIY